MAILKNFVYVYFIAKFLVLLQKLEEFIHGLPWPELKTGESLMWSEYQQYCDNYYPLHSLSAQVSVTKF